MILGILKNLFDITNNNRRWLLLLSACVVFGCVSLPGKDYPIWPWEYDRGQGEPNTGDYAAIRAGVTKFGKPPEAVKPITLESTESPSSEARLAAEKIGASPVDKDIATKSEPSAASQQGAEKADRNNKNGYDFYVSGNKSTSASSLVLDKVSPTYNITAFNHGNAPVSVAIDILQGSSQNTSADRTLPHYAVVPENSDLTLVHFSAKRKDQGFNLRYNSAWSIGDYTATHNCPEQYRFPFGEKVRAFASVADATDATPYTRYAVVFSMPKETPILAARKGTVIQISSDGKIDILHEDSTIGTYYHLEKITEYVVEGKAVTTDDIIGIAGMSENSKDAYMQLTVWRPVPTTSDQLRKSSQRIGFEAVSYPLAFISTESDKGKILIKNQPVSRGKLPSSNKQTKRK